MFVNNKIIHLNIFMHIIVRCVISYQQEPELPLESVSMATVSSHLSFAPFWFHYFLRSDLLPCESTIIILQEQKKELDSLNIVDSGKWWTFFYLWNEIVINHKLLTYDGLEAITIMKYLFVFICILSWTSCYSWVMKADIHPSIYM